MRRNRRIGHLVVVMAMVWAALATGAAAQEADDGDVYPMVFPIAGDYSYGDTYGAPRSEGRTHAGTDIFAEKGTPVVAVAPGVVVRIALGERAGRYIVVEHDDGWRSYYLHLDNDTPGTDDGLAGAPAPGIVVGARVEAGQVLDYVGDSGNAESTPPHLHFELHDAKGNVLNPYPHLRAAEGNDVVFTGATTRPAVTPRRLPKTLNTKVVGSYDPGDGFNSGIAVHDGTAYLGTWGRPDVCPGTGVRLIDVTDPTDPQPITEIATGDDFPGTSTDSMWVGAVDNEWFTGDLAVVALRRCDNTEPGRAESGFRGLAFYNVTNPEKPKLLSKLATGGATQGAHEIDVTITTDGSLLVATTVMQSLLHTDGRRGDVRIIEATNPRKPIEVSDWDLRRDAPADLVDEMLAGRDEEELHAHGVTFAADGEWLWVAHWDGGVVLLDISTLSRPTLVATAGFDAAAEGNAHSIAYDDERGLLIRSNEDLFPADTTRHVEGWGGQQLYRVTLAGKISQLGEFVARLGTEDDTEAAPVVPEDGFYSAHEAVIVDDVEYAAWYSAGVRLVDVSNPNEPVEIGYFIPPPKRDATGYWNAPDGTGAFPLVWGVTVDDGLIYASDINSGLWIVEFDDGLSEEMRDPGPTNWSPVK